MASFDIVNKIDIQLMDNAMNTAKKEILNRYDFQGTNTEIEFDKKDFVIQVTVDNELKLKAVEDIILMRSVKQGVDGKALDFTKEVAKSGSLLKKNIPIRQGIDKDTAKKIVKMIKDKGLKVQASIMDDQVRVTGKKIDDLQTVIAFLRGSDMHLPLQFVNMKS